MRNSELRIKIDTNLWISALITKDFLKLKTALTSSKITLLVSNELFLEIITVTQKPKLQKHFSTPDVGTLIELFDEYAVYVNVTTEVNTCRDFKDNFLLSLAIDGNADYLITGDNDLLILKAEGQTQILTMSEFLTIITS